jgi:molybdenum cofactor synthesis domain-containing protein
MTVASHGEWSLLEKTELRITGISLDQANLSEVAKTVARTLSLPPEEVYVIDARERLITLDILRTTVDPYSLVGRERELLTALGQLPGVRVDDGAAVRAEGMLGWIAADAETGRDALDRSRDMVAEIQRTIASRAIVFSTGNEVVSRNIEDTNKPWIVERLRQANFRPTAGPDLPDDTDLIAASFREAAEELGFGLVISTGGVGAETKDGTVEALLRLCPDAATPYLFTVREGHGRHAKPGVRIGLGEVAGSLVVCLPGPHEEATLGIEKLLDGLGRGMPLRELAEHIASALRSRLITMPGSYR